MFALVVPVFVDGEMYGALVCDTSDAREVSKFRLWKRMYDN